MSRQKVTIAVLAIAISALAVTSRQQTEPLAADATSLLFSPSVVSLESAGDSAGFKAGEPNGHHIVNRSNAPAVLFEIGTRSKSEIAHYSDVDLVLINAEGQLRFTRRDGTPIIEP